jgi:hypothetical protein
MGVLLLVIIVPSESIFGFNTRMGTPLSSARSSQMQAGALFAAVALAATDTSYFAGLYRISIALAAATVILLFGYRSAVMGDAAGA